MNLTIGSTHFKVTIASLGWVAAAAFLLLFFRVGGSSGLDTALAGAKRELATRSTWLKRVQALQDSAARARRAARALAADTTRLRQSRDSAQRDLASFVFAIDSAHRNGFQRALTAANDACTASVTNCEERATKWEGIARQEGTRADLATARANTSDSTLKSVGGAAECHLVHVGPLKLFGCPSRLTAFKVGIVGGGVLIEGLRLALSGHL